MQAPENREQDWLAGNEAALRAQFERVRGYLVRAGTESVAVATGDTQSDPELNSSEAIAGPLAMLIAEFGLSNFERDLLLACAALEVDADFAASLAACNGGSARMDFACALAILPEPHWSALLPEHPLRRWRLLELDQREGLTRQKLQIPERVLHFLLGFASSLDPIFYAIGQRVAEPPAQYTDESEPQARRGLSERIALALVAQPLQCIQLYGSSPADLRATASAAAALQGLQLFRLFVGAIPTALDEQESLARLWEREAVLGNFALLIDLADAERAQIRTALEFVERLQVPCMISSAEPLSESRLLRIAVPKPNRKEQQALWLQHLGDAGAQLNGDLGRIQSQFHLNPDEIAVASESALAEYAAQELQDGFGQILWDSCRALARPAMADLADRIEARALRDDLILPPLQLQIISDLAMQVRHREQVYHEWGFADRNQRGLGISALFAGPSGTGKTMAAEVLAGELGLDLYRIDLSQVVSKYIGETEKNLRRVFDAAEGGGAILLFDEADALFGKRSEVKDSHDRHANIEVSYLLQRMESYRGLAILTTNLKASLDSAFLRRIRFVINFPFPDVPQRKAIWERAFPANAPLDRNINYDQLARLNVAGGNIKNIALAAAFQAAERGTQLGMGHLMQAVRAEYQKIEKTLSANEFRDWAVQREGVTS